MTATFDDFEGQEFDHKEQKPFWTVNVKDDKAVLEWLKKDLDIKRQQATGRLEDYRENLALYKGIHFRSQDTRTQAFNETSGSKRDLTNPKMVLNYVHDMVEMKLSKMTRFRTNTVLLPTHGEINDANNAKMIKMAVDTRWYDVNMDQYIRNQQRHAFLYGEGYIFTGWNKDIGDILPAYKKKKKKGEKVYLYDDEGNKTGEVLTDPVHIGDVEYRNVTPDKIFPQKQPSWDRVEHLTELDFKEKEALKKDYPNKAELLEEDNSSNVDLVDAETFKDQGTAFFTFWHKPSKYLPKGRKIVFTENNVLENEDYPYMDKEGNPVPYLPYDRLTDIDVPGELHGRSFIRNIKQPQRHANNLASQILRNHGIYAHPKWVAQAGTVKREAFDNNGTIMWFKGPFAPKLVSSNPTPSEVFNYLEKLEMLIERFSGVHGISAGKIPPQISAGIALQFLDEQETERSDTLIAKKNANAINITKKTMQLMGQFYKDTDGRYAKLFGKYNEYMTKSLKDADFARSYDVRIQNASSLPLSRASKTQTLIDLKTAFPTLLKDVVVLDLLDLAQDQKFRDKATVSVKAAESENDDFFEGREVTEPKPWEDLLIHYEIHMRDIQERTFKDDTDPANQARLQAHIMGTEMLMLDKASKNPLFRQKLLEIDSYPVFFTLPDGFTLDMFMTAPVPGQQPGPAVNKIGDSGLKEPEEDMASYTNPPGSKQPKKG